MMHLLGKWLGEGGWGRLYYGKYPPLPPVLELPLSPLCPKNLYPPGGRRGLNPKSQVM